MCESPQLAVICGITCAFEIYFCVHLRVGGLRRAQAVPLVASILCTKWNLSFLFGTVHSWLTTVLLGTWRERLCSMPGRCPTLHYAAVGGGPSCCVGTLSVCDAANARPHRTSTDCEIHGQ